MFYSQKAQKLRIISSLSTCLNVPDPEWYRPDASGIGPVVVWFWHSCFPQDYSQERQKSCIMPFLLTSFNVPESSQCRTNATSLYRASTSPILAHSWHVHKDLVYNHVPYDISCKNTFYNDIFDNHRILIAIFNWWSGQPHALIQCPHWMV